MTAKEKRLLIRQAAKLATLGVTVERERKKLRKLVEQGVPYSDTAMVAAYESFRQTDAEWKRLEAEYLVLRKRLALLQDG